MRYDRHRALVDSETIAVLSAPAAKVLFVLERYMNDENGEGYPGRKRLIRETGLAKNTVRKAILELEQIGVIWIEDRGPGAAGRTQFVYHRVELQPGYVVAPLEDKANSQPGHEMTPLNKQTGSRGERNGVISRTQPGHEMTPNRIESDKRKESNQGGSILQQEQTDTPDPDFSLKENQKSEEVKQIDANVDRIMKEQGYQADSPEVERMKRIPSHVSNYTEAAFKEIEKMAGKK